METTILICLFEYNGTSKEKPGSVVDGDAAPVPKVVPTPVRSLVVEPEAPADSKTDPNHTDQNQIVAETDGNDPVNPVNDDAKETKQAKKGGGDQVPRKA